MTFVGTFKSSNRDHVYGDITLIHNKTKYSERFDVDCIFNGNFYKGTTFGIYITKTDNKFIFENKGKMEFYTMCQYELYPTCSNISDIKSGEKVIWKYITISYHDEGFVELTKIN